MNEVPGCPGWHFGLIVTTASGGLQVTAYGPHELDPVEVKIPTRDMDLLRQTARNLIEARTDWP